MIAFGQSQGLKENLIQDSQKFVIGGLIFVGLRFLHLPLIRSGRYGRLMQAWMASFDHLQTWTGLEGRVATEVTSPCMVPATFEVLTRYVCPIPME